MSEPIPPDPGLIEIEAALAALAPSRSRLDRDRLMFLAGRASRPRSAPRWAWPAVAATLAFVAAGEAIALGIRPIPATFRAPTIAEEPIPPGPAPFKILVRNEPEMPPAFGPRDGLRGLMLRLGPEGLPEPAPYASRVEPPAADPEPSGRLLRSEIARLLNPGEPS